MIYVFIRSYIFGPHCRSFKVQLTAFIHILDGKLHTTEFEYERITFPIDKNNITVDMKTKLSSSSLDHVAIVIP